MYEYKCNITRVVDGDTVDAEIDCGFDIVFKSRIRLYGIDTPESRTRDLDEKARGKMASKFLKDHIQNAKLVEEKSTSKNARTDFPIPPFSRGPDFFLLWWK